MPEKLRWGVLGAAKIAVAKVIPAMKQSELCEIAAIASRELSKAREAAAKLGIPKSYGSYEALLADPEIDCIYNPLPNHLHLPWTVRAAEAGKHVLCEKPIGLNAGQARQLIAVRDRTGVRIAEAFMVRVHPQWLRAREIVRSGEIGALRAVQGFFTYNNQDPKNIRNIPEFGGGAIMDIGCYPVTMSRFLFGEEPRRALALIERDPVMGTDRLTSAILDFPAGQATLTCGTQVFPYQKMHAFGTQGRVELDIPFNAPPELPARLLVFGPNGSTREETFPLCDQYTLQGDAFARAVRDGTEVPVTLEDSAANMKAIDALFESASKDGWATIS
jgi:predicted dehydrogenase